MNKISLYKGRKVYMYCFLIWMYLFCLASYANTDSSKRATCLPAGREARSKKVLCNALRQAQGDNVLLIDHSILKLTQQTITGMVTDANGALPGVTVSIKGKAVSTITDEKGQFSIAAEVGDTLVFTYIGYTTVAVAVTVDSVYNVTMIEDATNLKEVTVNAGYYTVKEKERTGSISKISSKDIEKQPVTNVLAAMQGRMAGVDIIQDGGTPGGGFQIKIRGLNSLRNDGNSPLYIIDGVPYSSESIGYSNTTTGMASTTSPLNSINPNDVESLEVLKDADATAIYGSRGANGVVLITTKKGKVGKTKVTVSASSGTGQATRFIDLMNTQQYVAMRLDGFANDGITTLPATAYDVNGTWDMNRYTDWQKELFGGTAQFQNLQATVTGGTVQTQYLLSGSTSSETTVIPGDWKYRKTGGHFNMNHKSDDGKFKLSSSGSYAVIANKQSATDLSRIVRNLAPNAPALYTPDGELNYENNTFQNPLAYLKGYSTVATNDFVANAVLSYFVTPSLELKANLGYTDLRNYEQRVLPSTMNNPALNATSATSQLFDNATARQSNIIEPQIHWAHGFGKGKLDVLVGGTAQMQETSRQYQVGIGFASNSLITNMASASQKFVLASDITEYRYQAFFGRVNYNHNDKYIVNVTGRRDGSSRFGPGKQFATFGAVGAAWLFSNESYLKDNKWLSFGKLRMSYGTTGNDQIGDYQFLNTYSNSTLNYQGVVGLEPTRLFNPEFGWEKNTKLEAAIETGFLNDRIMITYAWYRNRSSNQLVGVPLPGTTGFSSISANLDATVQNRGVELSIRTENIRAKDFKWSTNFNIAMAKNKLLSFPGLAGSTYANTLVVGKPTTIVKVYHYLGVNPETGLYEVEDLNGDGVITAAGDKQKVEDLTPEYFGGLQNQLQYKQWQLDFLFQFVKQQAYNYNPNAPGGNLTNQSVAFADSWQQSGDIATHQMHTSGANSAAMTAFSRYAGSDAIIVNGSYIRLKNIALTYSVPLKTKDASCKVSLQAQNLLTFTPYKGGDPEFRYTSYLPPLRTITAGVQLSF